MLGLPARMDDAPHMLSIGSVPPQNFPNMGRSLHPDIRRTRTRVKNARGVELSMSQVGKTRLLTPGLGMSCILRMKERVNRLLG